MEVNQFSRREYLKLLGAGAVSAPFSGLVPIADEQADRDRRMRWWHDAKFGMFIHWGLYSVLARHEWVMEMEGIPVSEYEPLARQFKPRPNAARDWARLAKRAGMKYMVMTTKHHEGFCLFDTNTTSFCAPKQAAGRDLVKEYVEAVRAEGLRVGFYFSLMDWHHPDGARCQTDEAARQRFIQYVHAQIRELLTNYGKVDILWYDVPWPLDTKGWESEKMNQMVFQLQPDIIVNNRNDPNKQMGDFSTPEQRIEAAEVGRAWEACMTMNDSWGYHAADDGWKTPKQVIRNLITCAHDGGNYLINVGPKADGSIPSESTDILSTVGEWMDKNGSSLYGADRCQPTRCRFGSFSRKGNTLYLHVHYWPGETVALAGLLNKVKSAKLLATGKQLAFQQDDYRVRFTGLQANAPDTPITTIAIECDGEPKQDQLHVRRRERAKV